MKPTRRLRELWNWLPVFRAVAETEHLPTAAKALFISPASLSRTIGLLEENIGSPLFDRVGRNLRLNSSGAILLDAVRDGMRAIDEGVSSVNDSLWNGQLCLWADRDFATYFLLPVIGELRKKQPTLDPLLRTTDINSVPERILRGQIDLALLETPPSHKQLKVDRLLELPYALYCAPTNALATRDTLAVQELSDKHSFAIVRSESGEDLDSYPAESPRKSILVVEDMTMAIRACFELNMVTCLPCIVGEAANLHLLPLDVLPPNALYAVYRKPIGTHPRTELLLEILHNQIKAKAGDCGYPYDMGGSMAGKGKSMSKYTGTIKKNDLSGGFWELVSDSGERYQLEGGDAKLQVEGNQVTIDGSVQSSSMGIGMVGSILKVNSWTSS